MAYTPDIQTFLDISEYRLRYGGMENLAILYSVSGGILFAVVGFIRYPVFFYPRNIKKCNFGSGTWTCVHISTIYFPSTLESSMCVLAYIVSSVCTTTPHPINLFKSFGVASLLTDSNIIPRYAALSSDFTNFLYSLVDVTCSYTTSSQ